MLSKRELWESINSLIGPEGLEVFDLELPTGKQGVLRVFICKEGGDCNGITHDFCSAAARRINGESQFDWLRERYSLEVSSPGVNRKLSRPEHFHGAIGERVRLTMDAENPKKRRVVVGQLVAIEDTNLQVEVDGAEGAESLSMQDVVKARVDFLFD